MLRTLVLALALAAPGVAMADDFPQSALHAPVVSDTGAVLGRVNAVERDAQGRIVAAEIDGLEPPSAPYASQDLVAERERAREVLMNGRRADRQLAANQRTRAR
ncbi:MAG TPA: hypothetical protein PLK37_01070 [Terricaulis sp.]|nr:hypothetical protein [Terricaulis sp.]